MRYLPPTPRAVRLRIAGATALAGMVVMYVVLVAFGEPQPLEWQDDEVWMFPSAAVGAFAGGYATAGLAGLRADLFKRLLALVGFLIATAIGSAIGGAVWAVTRTVEVPDTLGSMLAMVDAIVTGVPSAALFCVVVVMGATPMEAPWSVLVWLALGWAVDRVAAAARG